MQIEIKELEAVLNQEIEAYSKLEQYILDKKDSLIKGDIDKLKNIDFELEKYSNVVEKLELKRSEINSKTGNENLTLKEIINRIESEEQSQKLSNMRSKLKNLVSNIQKQNRINALLIDHSLKLVEHTVVSIANVLIPESSAYNNMGKIKSNTNKEGVSSIIEEA